MSEMHDCRNAFAKALEELARQDERIMVVCNDSIGSSKLENFRRLFPDRLVNVGIAEQNMVGFAAGLANAGKIPFVTAPAAFLTGRALEQIKVDAAYSYANVKLVGVSSGLAYGEFGATHHSLEDIAWTRAIARMTVIVPADPPETAQAVQGIARFDGPVFLRTSRIGVPVLHSNGYQFQIGKASLLREGRDLTIISNGVLVSRALEAASLLESNGVSARVVNMATVSPIDRQAIQSAAEETGAILTAEEHTVHGGLGSAVAEVVVETCPVPMRLLGIPHEFVPTGPAAWLLDHYGLSAEGLRQAGLQLISRKGSL